MSIEQAVSAAFRNKFRREPLLVRAPGRINLMGEHTDYNDGFVMPGAIDRHFVFAAAAGRRDRCNIYALDFDEGVTFSMHDLNPGETWVNYLMGVLDGFTDKNLPVQGVDVMFSGNIPVGAGASSSAALCCGFAFAINEIFQLGLSRLELARIAQRAEHEFAGAKVGIMDQYASLFGKKDSVFMLDCRNLTHEYLPFSYGKAELLLVDTKVEHTLASSAYNDRRAACETGVELLKKHYPQVHALRDANEEMLREVKPQMEPAVYEKCRYAIKEIARTKRAAQLLKSGDLLPLGELLYETHWGLSKEYEVSCAESDWLVTLASQHPDLVLGARQMGGGFGGCTINLVKKGAAGEFTKLVKEKYVATFQKEPDFYPVNLSDGVNIITQVPSSQK